MKGDYSALNINVFFSQCFWEKKKKGKQNNTNQSKGDRDLTTRQRNDSYE